MSGLIHFVLITRKEGWHTLAGRIPIPKIDKYNDHRRARNQRVTREMMRRESSEREKERETHPRKRIIVVTYIETAFFSPFISFQFFLDCIYATRRDEVHFLTRYMRHGNQCCSISVIFENVRFPRIFLYILYLKCTFFFISALRSLSSSFSSRRVSDFRSISKRQYYIHGRTHREIIFTQIFIQ